MIPAIALALILLLAIFLVLFFGADRAAAEPTTIYMDSTDDRMLFSLESMELGAVTQQGDGDATTESIQWSRLAPYEDERDNEAGPVAVASGETDGGPWTKARFTFASVGLVKDSSLNTLRLPQDTLELQLPEAGNPGDALLITFDTQASLLSDNGLLSFSPQVASVSWHAGLAASEEAPPRASAGERPGQSPSDSSDPSRTPGAPDGGGTQTPSQPSTPTPKASVGMLRVAFEGETAGLVESLNTTIKRIALAPQEDPDAPQTRFDGLTTVDLVAASELENGTVIATFQVPAQNYSALYFEFDSAQLRLSGHFDQRDAQIPQPLLVVESGFQVPLGETVTTNVRFSVEESLRVGLQGYEFRPVVTSFTANGTHGEDLVAPYPAQFRTGGPWLPLLGERLHQALSENVTDPYQVPHPLYGEAERPPWSNGSLQHAQPPQQLPLHNCMLSGALCLSIDFIDTEEGLLDPILGHDPTQRLLHDRALVVPAGAGVAANESQHAIMVASGMLTANLDMPSGPEASMAVPLWTPSGSGFPGLEEFFPREVLLASLDYHGTGEDCFEELCEFRLVDPKDADAEAQERKIGEIRYAQITLSGTASVTVSGVPVIVLES